MRQTNISHFYETTRVARRIVVVDLGFLGDTLHLVPSLWEIKRHYPQSSLHVISSPLGAEVLRLAPCVERSWPLEIHPDRRTRREHWQIIRAVRRERFDIAFNFGGNDRAIILTGMTGARWRLAHAAGRKHFWNRWLIAHWVPRQDPGVSVLEQRRLVLAACGFQLKGPRFDLKVDDNALKWAADVVPAVAIHLSINSANPLKEWPLEHHASLLRILWHDQPAVQVVASAGSKDRERDRLRRLAARVNDPRLRLLPDDLSIAQLAGVLTRCRLHIGPDSGVMHLAVALGVPTISFFRAQGEYRSWLPAGEAHRVMLTPCTCVDHYQSPCEALGQAECLARITPEQVARLLRERLEGIVHVPDP